MELERVFSGGHGAVLGGALELVSGGCFAAVLMEKGGWFHECYGAEFLG